MMSRLFSLSLKLLLPPPHLAAPASRSRPALAGVEVSSTLMQTCISFRDLNRTAGFKDTPKKSPRLDHLSRPS